MGGHKRSARAGSTSLAPFGHTDVTYSPAHTLLAHSGATKVLPVLCPSTSTDSLTDISPASGSATDSGSVYPPDAHDGVRIRVTPPPAAASSSHHRHPGRRNSTGKSAHSYIIAHAMQQGRIPSRHGSLDSLVNYDGSAAARSSVDSAMGDSSSSTAPPLRLPKRASLSGGTSPSSTGLVHGVCLTPTSRHLGTPTQTALATTRPRVAEADGGIGYGRSLSQDQTVTSSVNARTAHPAQVHQLPAIIADSIRRVSVPPSRENSQLSRPPATPSKTAAAHREEGREGVVAPMPPAALSGSAGAEAVRRASPLLSRRRSASTRETSNSPSVDSPAGDDDERLSDGQQRQRNASVGAAGEAGVKSPSAGPKRVHFSLEQPTAITGSFLASAARSAVGDAIVIAGSGSSARAAVPVKAALSPLALELTHSPLEGSSRLGLSTDSRYSTASSSASTSRLPAAPASALAAPGLSLRLNVRDGRIEALATPNSSILAAPRSSFASPTAVVGEEAVAGATYKPQMPLPKPALKSYSRYSGDAEPAKASELAAPKERRGSGAARGGVMAALSQSAAGWLGGAGPRRRSHHRASLSHTPADALALPPAPQRVAAAPLPLSSPAAVVKWVLLLLAALLSIALIAMATFAD